MLHITPILHPQDEKIKKLFSDIQETLNIGSIPLPFCYMANFSNYLSYMWPYIKNTLQSKHIRVAQDHIRQTFTIQEQILLLASNKFLQKHHIEVNKYELLLPTMNNLLQTYIYLSIIFLYLRESVKGYPPLIKYKLSAAQENTTNTSKSLFDNHEIISQNSPSTDLAVYTSLSKDYLMLLDELFLFVRTTDEYVYVRLSLEKIMLEDIDTLPFNIPNTYNIVLPLIENEKYYDDLLYLLSDDFSTITLSKMMVCYLGVLFLTLKTSPSIVHVKT